jgi:NADH-quinone oxidoreductase subunit A
MTHAATPFLPALILLLVTLGVGVITLLLSSTILPWLHKPKNPQAGKLTPYECGVPLMQENARKRYSVKFYLVAVFFILFDVEAAFLLPWAVIYRTHPGTFMVMLLFFATLAVGFIYAWGKGALDWEK